MLGHQVALALATCLHQVGLIDPELTERAVSGIAELNARVWLSDVFERQSADVAALLRSAPVALTRSPPTRETITFTRLGDLLAIRTGDVYVIGHVHGDTALNQAPVVELYETTFAQLPEPDNVVGSRAAGEQRGDGPASVSVLGVFGLRHIPDPAEQIALIDVAQKTLPDRSHLVDRGVGWTVRISTISSTRQPRSPHADLLGTVRAQATDAQSPFSVSLIFSRVSRREARRSSPTVSEASPEAVWVGSPGPLGWMRPGSSVRVTSWAVTIGICPVAVSYHSVRAESSVSMPAPAPSSAATSAASKTKSSPCSTMPRRTPCAIAARAYR